MGLDDYRLGELLVSGPGGCLLAGVGYMPAQSAATLDDHAAAMKAAEEDWAVHGEGLTRWWVEGWPHGTITPGGPGTRPWAWWQFSAPAPRSPGETEAAYLKRHRLLLPGEAA
jgi:hypothetical protein